MSESPHAPRVVEIDLQTRYGRLRGKLPMPPTGMRLSELAWNAMALDGRLIDMAVTAEAKENRMVACKKGCGACCRQAVPVSAAEAWMLADIVAAFPPERKTHVLARFAAAHEQLQSRGFGDRSLGDTSSPKDVLTLGLDYFRLGIPCPFLEDESCSIHPNRPSACREYLVTSPAAHCAEPDKKPLTPVPLALSLTEALSKLSAQLMGSKPVVIPMTLALEWALAHKEEGQKRYDGVFLMTSLIELLK